jgi:hypothetical protein
LKTRDIRRGRGEGEHEGAGKNAAAEQDGVQGRTGQTGLADRAAVRRGGLPCAFFPSPQPTRQILARDHAVGRSLATDDSPQAGFLPPHAKRFASARGELPGIA